MHPCHGVNRVFNVGSNHQRSTRDDGPCDINDHGHDGCAARDLQHDVLDDYDYPTRA